MQFTTRRITISISQYNAEEAFTKIQNLLINFETKNKVVFSKIPASVLEKIDKNQSKICLEMQIACNSKNTLKEEKL